MKVLKLLTVAGLVTILSAGSICCVFAEDIDFVANPQPYRPLWRIQGGGGCAFAFFAALRDQDYPPTLYVLMRTACFARLRGAEFRLSLRLSPAAPRLPVVRERPPLRGCCGCMSLGDGFLQRKEGLAVFL